MGDDSYGINRDTIERIQLLGQPLGEQVPVLRDPGQDHLFFPVVVLVKLVGQPVDALLHLAGIKDERGGIRHGGC